jgi:hypothetical protein
MVEKGKETNYAGQPIREGYSTSMPTEQRQTQLILLYTKGKYITWALRSSIIFLHTLKIYLIILGKLKFV